MANKSLIVCAGLSLAALLVLSITKPSEEEFARIRQQKIAQQNREQLDAELLQSEVAAKKSWQFVKSSDSKMQTATSAIDASLTRSLIGKSAAFTGVVQSITSPPSNSPSLINFGSKNSGALLLVLKEDKYAAFPPISQLQGERILVEGDVTLLTNQKGEQFVEIVLERPEQIAIARSN